MPRLPRLRRDAPRHGGAPAPETRTSGAARRDALLLAALAFALALAQRPGEASSDTKIDLHVDPMSFLADVASVWTPTGDLGHVHGGQYAGYLFPMGPFFALGDLAGLAPWLVDRLWLGAVLAVATVGAVRLAGALLPKGGAPARLTAGAITLLNPYVVVFANRTSVTLLAYALLPWMLLAVHSGLRHPRNWWWPAAGALIVASAGGGVNTAVLAWLLLAPAALLLYEPAVGAVGWRDARDFALRTAACLTVTSLWWIAPVAVHAFYGSDFLPFTEQPGVIWSTTSASEVLRLMGYWTTYIGVGYTGRLHPFTSDAGVLLFHPAVLVATLLVPAAVAAGLLPARRWAYAPYFLALLLGGALIVMAGFPDGTPLRRAALAAYFHVPAIQFLRTTYKAAPLIVIALALLAAAAAPAVWARLGRVRLPAAAAAVAVLALSAWPLVRGQAVDAQLTWDAVPAAWTDAARDLDAELPPNTRALVLPAQLFATYEWASTIDPVLPALSDRPVAARTVLAYGDRRSVDLLWAVDGLVQQERVVPGQLPPLLRLLGVGAVVRGSDDDSSRSGAVAPARAAAQLALGGLRPPDRAYGQVVRHDLPPGPGLVRVEAGPQTLVDGSAETLTGLAALGGLDPRRPLAYAADRSPDELRAAARTGADVVIGDGNRRRVIVASRTRREVGPTLAVGEEMPPDAAVLDPVQAGEAAQTVAEYDGIRAVREDMLPGVKQFPEHRPFAALDGAAATSWVAPRHLDFDRDSLEVELVSPRDVPYVDVLPRDRTAEVDIGGRRYPLRPGWNRLPVDLRDVQTVRVRIAGVRRARGVRGGLAELRIPGVRAHEWLRPPRLLEDALRGTDLDRAAISYVFQRTTGAAPFRRPAQDAEEQIARRIAPPAPRRFRADGWATVSPTAPDPALDAVAGTRGGRFDSSGRVEGRPGLRASRAFDGDPRTAWIAPWDRGAWLSWTTPRGTTIRSLVLRPAAGVRRPTMVRVLAADDERPAAIVPVGPDGRVDLPRPVRGRAFRLEVVAARMTRPAAGTAEVVAGTPSSRAVGIAEVVRAHARSSGGRERVTTPCGALRLDAGGEVLRLKAAADAADFDAGIPLRARPCGRATELPAREIDVTTASSLLRPYWLRLHSPAPDPPAATGGGRVTDTGTLGRASVDGVRLQLSGPSRLVLAQGYNRGWRAWCGDRPLGPPQPDAAYGNGWAVDATCTSARFAFVPDRAVRVSLLASGAACLLMLIALILRRPPTTRPEPATDLPAADRPPRTTWRRAAALGLLAGAAAAALIALRAGPPVAVLVTLVARLGIGSRPLIVAAAALLGIAVPATYLLFTPKDRGGYNVSYASDLIEAHWLAIAALVLLALALWRMITGRRAPAPARPPRATPDRAPAAPDPEPAA